MTTSLRRRGRAPFLVFLCDSSLPSFPSLLCPFPFRRSFFPTPLPSSFCSSLFLASPISAQARGLKLRVPAGNWPLVVDGQNVVGLGRPFDQGDQSAPAGRSGRLDEDMFERLGLFCNAAAPP